MEFDKENEPEFQHNEIHGKHLQDEEGPGLDRKAGRGKRSNTPAAAPDRCPKCGTKYDRSRRTKPLCRTCEPVKRCIHPGPVFPPWDATRDFVCMVCGKPSRVPDDERRTFNIIPGTKTCQDCIRDIKKKEGEK